jgi:hypothetical protein
VLVVNPARPVPAQRVLERLGLAGACGRRAHNLGDEAVDPFQLLSVVCLPVQGIFPGLGRKDQVYGSKARARPCPASRA